MSDFSSGETVEHYDYDVVNLSDFRLPGGTSHSIYQEVLSQSEAGFSTGLVHVPSGMIRRALPWSPPMRKAVGLPGVFVVPPGKATRTRLLVIRHPSSVKDLSRVPATIRPDRLVVVANHAARDSDGTLNYDVIEIDAELRRTFGVAPEWRPIGPVVRETLQEFKSEVNLGDDWVNIIVAQSTQVRRTAVHSPRATIGRHSRPQPAKWPSLVKDIKDAYPMDKEFDVRILGGSRAAELVLNKRPSNWTVFEFGSMAPSDFLAEIDFWVYFHHPHTLEAYGRAIMEAMDAGCVVILPKYLEPTFGSAAVYAEPREVREVIRRFSADRDTFIAQSMRGQNFVRRMGPDVHTERLATYGIRPRTKDLIPDGISSAEISGPKRVLFLTSNGAGMGHLTRLLAIARASNKERLEPFFLSLSQGVPVVGAQGFPYEYIASSGAMVMPAPEWNEYLLQRLGESVRVLRPAAIVFDGTVPYVGLVKFLQECELFKVWIRRGMWKKEASGKSLTRESNFDLVIEPGEYAREYDEGPTSKREGRMLVNPITVLEPRETLSREEARAHMGMPADEKSVLLTMGAGNINDIGDIQDAILNCFAESHPDWQVYVTKPPIAESIGKSSLNVLETYPLARIARAFDFAISAAGYNSFHEWTSMQIPTLWIPNEQTSVDDQLGRARWAQDRNVGLCFSGRPGEDLSEQIAVLANPEVRDSMRIRMGELTPSDGALSAAAAIAEGLEL